VSLQLLYQDFPKGFFGLQQWNYFEGVAELYSINEKLLSQLVPTFGEQGRLHKEAANLLGLSAGILSVIER